MHEMSYVVRFVNDAMEAVADQNVQRITGIEVSVGEMTGVLPEYLYKYYPQAVKGTILEGSVLKVDMVPIQVECASCSGVYHPDKENGYLCPSCGSADGKVLSGRDVVLERVEVV